MKKWLIALAMIFSFQGMAFMPVDLNTASQEQLEAIHGLGPAKAKAIVEYRTKNGPFKTIEDLKKVTGIKEGVFNQVKSEIVVNSKGAAGAPPSKAAPVPKAPKK